jgi:hypothetical protein
MPPAAHANLMVGQADPGLVGEFFLGQPAPAAHAPQPSAVQDSRPALRLGTAGASVIVVRPPG